MERHRLGRSDVEVSALSFGGAEIGGLYEPLPEEEAAATVRAALDQGLRYVDTAPHYGAGLSEQRIGRVLAGEARDTFVVSTKVGRRLRPRRLGEPPDEEGFPAEPALTREWDWSRDGVRRALSDSLERLSLDHVDIVYLHDPDRHERLVYDHAFPALAELRAEGAVGAIGAGMTEAGMLARFVTRLDLDAVLCAGRYTLLDQSALVELLPACASRGVSVVVGGVFNSGLLADPRPGARYDYASASPDLLARALRMRDVCAAHDVPLAAAAMRFPFGHPAVASVLVGCRTQAEVHADASMFRTSVPADLWRDLRDEGLLSPSSPLPSGP